MREFVQIKGGKQLDSLLRELPGAIAKKIMRQSLRESAKLIQIEARARAPVDTGKLKKSIKVRANKKRKKNTISYTVITGAGDFSGDEFYASFLEWGSGARYTKSGKFVGAIEPAQPFLRPAFDAKKEAAIEHVAAAIRSRIAAVASGEFK